MSAPAPQLDPQNPWPGLLPFNEAAERYFHGREAESEDLLRLVQRQQLAVLFGKSGLGKTSLLLAGLFPRLRACQFLPVYIRLDLHDGAADPLDQVWAALAENLQRHRIEGREPGAGETLWEYFHHRDTDFWDRRNRLVTPVLVFDQFEEVLTVADRARVQPLLDALGDLVENRMPDSVRQALDAQPERAAALEYGRDACKVLLSFREDYLPEFERLRPLMPSLADGRMRLVPMNGRQARDAILAAGGHLFAPGIAERIIGFVAGSGDSVTPAALAEADLERMEIEPALLSVVCRELNNKRIEAGAAKITDALLAATPSEIIEGFYNSAVADVDEAGRRFIEDQLITSGGFRDSRALADALAWPGMTRAVIDRLVERRVLRLEERLGTLRVELTHDRLTPVIRRQRDRRREAEAERVRAEEAEAAIRRERERREAQERLTAEANARAREARRQFVRMRVLAGVALSLLGVAAGALGWGWIEQNNARRNLATAIQNGHLAEVQRARAEQNFQLAIENASKDASLISANLSRNGITANVARAMLEHERTAFANSSANDSSVAILRAKANLFGAMIGTYWHLGDMDALLKASRSMTPVVDKFAAAAPDDPIARVLPTLLHSTTCMALSAIGNFASAEAECNAAVALVKASPGRRLTADAKRAAGFVHAKAGFLLAAEHRWSEAAAEFRQGSDLYSQATDMTGYPDLMEADGLIGLAETLARQGELEAAIKELRRAEELITSMRSKDISNAALDLDLMTIDAAKATTAELQGKRNSADAYLRQASALHDALAQRQFAGNPLIIISAGRQRIESRGAQGDLEKDLRILGWLAQQPRPKRIQPAIRAELILDKIDSAGIRLLQGNAGRAETELQSAVSESDDFAAQYPTYPAAREVQARARFGFAEFEQKTGNSAAALAAYGAGMAIMVPLVTAHPSDAVWRHDLAVAEGRQGAIRLALGDADGATADLHAAETTLAALTAKDPSNVKWRADLDEARRQLAPVQQASKGKSPSAP